jgi:Domain of unknown function (DUF4920)
MKLLISSLAVLTLTLGCGLLPQATKPALSTSASWDSFGAPLTGAPEEVSLAALAADPARYDGKTVLVSGARVAQVCKKKGCWMTLDAAGTPVRVTFLDYGFFMPLDCEQRDVVFEGVFAAKVIPEADAKHYLEDAGKPEEAAKLVGDQKELTIIATGVRMAPK